MVDESQCLFCKIRKGEIPSKKVYEDSNAFAILDINPRNPGHALVIPKKHVVTVMEASEEDVSNLMKSVRKVAIAAQKTTNSDGVSILQSNGIAAGQVVAHLHFHVIPRFNNEGPVSLEGMLQVKKFDEESMNKIVDGIKKNLSSPSAQPAPAKKEVKKETNEESKKEAIREDIDFEF
jgi:histidine triad (HIT) family protein